MYLNLTHDVFAVPFPKVSRNCELSLLIRPDGSIKPTFKFRGKRGVQAWTTKAAECPEFYSQGFQIKGRSTYLGLDFGTSNSYLVKFASIPKTINAAEYPNFTVHPGVVEKLRKLELRLASLRDSDN
jgi:hypothetical protein